MPRLALRGNRSYINVRNTSRTAHIADKENKDALVPGSDAHSPGRSSADLRYAVTEKGNNEETNSPVFPKKDSFLPDHEKDVQLLGLAIEESAEIRTQGSRNEGKSFRYWLTRKNLVTSKRTKAIMPLLIPTSIPFVLASKPFLSFLKSPFQLAHAQILSSRLSHIVI